MFAGKNFECYGGQMTANAVYVGPPKKETEHHGIVNFI